VPATSRHGRCSFKVVVYATVLRSHSIADLTRHDLDPDVLVEEADTAMYNSKREACGLPKLAHRDA